MKKKYITKNTFIVFIIPIILLSKLVRFTVLSELIDNGIGTVWISLINSNMTSKAILGLKVAEGQNGFAILFFKYINIFHLSSYFSYEIFITIAFNIILISLLFMFKDKLTMSEVIFISFFIAVLNIFDFTLSKDSLQMIPFLVIFGILVSRLKHKYILTMLVIFITSMIFRRYYIFILLFGMEAKFIFDILFQKKKRYKLKLLMGILVIALTYIGLLKVCKIAVPDYYYELIRVRSRMTSANTNINNILSGSSNLVYGLNYLSVIIRLMFPVELLLGSVKYVIFIIFQLMITSAVFKEMKNYTNLGYEKKICLYIFFGFVFTSATFEPDFGSWIRHEAVLYPELIILFNLLREKYYLLSQEEETKKEERGILYDNTFKENQKEISQNYL